MKLYKKEKYQDKKSWLLARRIGGSGASALLGESPYQTALDVYCAIVNPAEIKDEQNTSTQYGVALEPIIRANVKENFKNKYRVQSPNGYTMYRRKDKPYMTATVDGLLTSLTDSKERWVLEIKTHEARGAEDMEKWNGKIPQNYFIQCLHYLAVMNDLAGCLFVAKIRYTNYDTGEVYKEEINYLKIERKDFEKDIAYLEKVETDFWENHVVKRIPPNIVIPIMEEETNV